MAQCVALHQALRFCEKQNRIYNEQMQNMKPLKCIVTCCILLVLNMAGPGSAQDITIPKLHNPVTVSYLTKNLKEDTPRLILTADTERRLKSNLEHDIKLRRYHQYLVREAESIMEKPLMERKLELFRMLSVSVEMVERLGTLAMVYRLDKDPLVLERINEELVQVCNFSDWNPQHFLDVAEMAFAVALAIDWVGEWLPESTVELAKEALIEKALIPSFNEEGIRMFWISSYSNWTAVCHSGILAAALMTFDKDQELATRAIHRALDKLPMALSAYVPDGVYPEGPSYWVYGTTYLTLASSMLTTSLGQDFGLYESEGFKGGPDFFLQSVAPSGAYFNFCDSDGRISKNSAMLLAWFATKNGDGKYLLDTIFENPGDFGRLAGPGILWLSESNTIKGQSALATAWYGRGKNPVAYFRNPDNKNQYYLASKGGLASVIHGNMDAGTFIFELNGVRWVVDPGNQSYQPLNAIGFNLSGRHQESERWTLLTKNNFNHSTLTINDAHHLVDGYVALTAFISGHQPEVHYDMTPVFEGMLHAATRKFIKDSDSSLLVEDIIETNDSTECITWGMMTLADVELIDHGAILKQDGQQLLLEIVSPENVNFSIISLDPPPLEIDKTIENLKRMEIRIPAWNVQNQSCTIMVRLSGI